MSTPVPHLYRSLLRELRLAVWSFYPFIRPRSKRNPVVNHHLRAIIDSTPQASQQRTLLETHDFLKASRIHSELLIRYNPLHDMTPEERVNASARRVGLDAPAEYKRE
ncbi:hypothetical protein P7C73_g6570, partial [Tremellales sp. Uapishka_1]